MSEPQNLQQNQWSVELLGADPYIDMYANSLKISYIALENIQIYIALENYVLVHVAMNF